MSTIKRRNYTFSIKRDFERIRDIVEQYGCYAYICHDKDPGVATHWHFYIEFPNPRSLNSVAEELGIEPNMIEACHNKMAILTYLTHNTEKAKKDGKHIYTFEEVITNMPEEAFIRNERIDPLELYDMYAAVRCGKMTPREFIEKYKVCILTQIPTQQIALFARLHEAYMADRFDNDTERRACLRSVFRVPPK